MGEGLGPAWWRLLYMLLWKRGQATSRPEDGRAWLESDTLGNWWVYKTEDGFPVIPDCLLLIDQPFTSVYLAEEWVEHHVDVEGNRVGEDRVVEAATNHLGLAE